MLSIPALFLIGILHYYGMIPATATATAVSSNPPQCNACCQGQPGLPGSGVPGVPGVPGIPGEFVSENCDRRTLTPITPPPKKPSICLHSVKWNSKVTAVLELPQYNVCCQG